MSIATLPHGVLEPYDDNEINLRSDIKDPGKYRTSVEDNLVESNLGSVSHNTRRANGELDERVQYGGRLLGDGTPAFFVALGIKKGDPVSEQLVVSRHGLSGPAAARSAASGRMYHEGGRFVTIYGDDGHVVTYDMHRTSDEPQWNPVWSSWHGLLRPLPW